MSATGEMLLEHGFVREPHSPRRYNKRNVLVVQTDDDGNHWSVFVFERTPTGRRGSVLWEAAFSHAPAEIIRYVLERASE